MLCHLTALFSNFQFCSVFCLFLIGGWVFFSLFTLIIYFSFSICIKLTVLMLLEIKVTSAELTLQICGV